MIKNPKKFMRKNKTLNEDMLRFLNTLVNRSESALTIVDGYANYCLEEAIENPDSSNILKRRSEEYRDKMMKTREYHGQIALSEPGSKSKGEIFNGKYLLIESNNDIFISDETIISICPLSTHVLLVYGDQVDHFNDLVMKRSIRFAIDLVNAKSLNNSTNVVIVGEQTSEEYIEKLFKRFPRLTKVAF